MKKVILILFVLLVTRLGVYAQSAVALFKPTYNGDEHYGFATGSDKYEAEQKAFGALKSAVNQKVGSSGSGAVGQQFIYSSTTKKGWYAIGRGKDQYGHYWHYEAVLGYNTEDAAKQYVLSRLSARGLYSAEIFSTGLDQ